MARVGASRPVTLRPAAQWFNPDELDEAAYAPANDVPFGRAAAGTGTAGRGGPGRGAAGRGATVGGRGPGRGAPLARPPSIGRPAPQPLKVSNSGEYLELEAADWGSANGGGGGGGGGMVGGGGMGGLRRVGSGVGPLGALKAPPPPAQIPDRPGTLTTTTRETDAEGRTITTKTVVTRTHSGRIRTEVTTTTSGPAHLINGGGIPPGGAVTLMPYDEQPPSPGDTVRLAQGSGFRAVRSSGGGGPRGASPDTLSPLSPLSPVSPASPSSSAMRLQAAGAIGPGGQSLLANGPAGGGRVSGSGAGIPAGGRRPSQTGIIPAAPAVRPPSAGMSASAVLLPVQQPARAAASPVRGAGQPPPAAAGGPARTTWGGGVGAAGPGPGPGGPGGAMRLSSPARLPAGAATAGAKPSPGAHASPGRMPSAGRMRMSPAFAAAHGLGGTGGAAGGVAVSGEPEIFMFSGGGGDGGPPTSASGRYGGAASALSPPDSPEVQEQLGRLRPLSGGGGGTAGGPGRMGSIQQRTTEGYDGASPRPAAVGHSPSINGRTVGTATGGPVSKPAPPSGATPTTPRPVGAAAAATAANGKPVVVAAPTPPNGKLTEAPPVPVAAARAAAGQAAAAARAAAGPAAAKAAAAPTAAKAPAPPAVAPPPAAAAAPTPAPPPRTPQPPPSPRRPTGDGGGDGRQGMSKALAAAKWMAGGRRNAGQCAVSLAFLRRFRSMLMKDRKDAAAITTSQVTQEVIKPMTQAHACRLADLSEMLGEAEVGPPDYFISHAWSMPFMQLLDCVFNHLQGALDSTRVWLDIFAVNQHPGAEQKDDLENLRTAIQLSQATLVCLDAAGTPLERVWCLYEFDNTLALKGADALVLLTPGFSIREIASIFRSIDVDAAKATVLSDKDMILRDIRMKHGSTEAFNNKLKLRFLLDPLDSKPDMMALAARAGTDPEQWNLGPVAAWLAEPSAPHVAVMTAAPGAGKSTVTAVLCMGPEAAAEVATAAAAGNTPDRPSTAARRRSSTPGMAARRLSTTGGGGGGVTVHAYHFCKYSDARRQDPVRVVKTLAYQLAHSFPALQPYYCSLDPGTLMQLNQPDSAARELLVLPLEQYTRGQQVLLVIDALDEADKAPQPTHGPGVAPPSTPSALDNKVLQLLLHQLSQLPDWVRILTTIRPDPHLLGPIRSKFPRLAEFVPSQLRRQDKTHQGMQTRLVERFGEATAKQLLAAGGGGGGLEGSLVYFPVVALLKAPLEKVPAGLGDAYAAVFKQLWPAGKDAARAQQVQKVLEVVVAAQEPPPMSLMAALGLQDALEALPGWGALFYERDHAVHVLHRTLKDWLEDKRAAGPHHADARRGHSLLGKHLLSARPLGVYGARYLVTHLIKAGSEQKLLDQALQDLGYLEAACRTGDVFKLHAELASLPPDRITPVVADVVRWLGLNGAVLWSHPQAVTQIAAEAPRCSTMWQVGDRSARHNPVDMLNEPYSWPLEVMALTQHKAPVPDVTYSPDGRLMVSASLDGSVRLWDADTGEPKAALSAPPAHCLCYSPAGDLLATGGERGTISLWDPTTGVPRDSMAGGHKDAVTALAFSRDGTLLASGGRDKMVRLWSPSPPPGSKRADLKGHSGPITLLAFSPDGKALASGAAEDPVPRLWGTAEGKLVAALEGHRQGVLSMAFCPTANLLATAADNVRLWDAASGAPRGALTDHLFPVGGVAFTPDGRILVSADTTHTLRLWAVAAGAGAGGAAAPAKGPKGRGPGGGGPPAGISALAVLEADASGQLTALAVSPNGSFVATASANGELHVFSVAGGGGGGAEGGGVFTVRAAHAGQVRRLAFSPDSQALVSASDDCTLRLWDPSTALAHRQRSSGSGGGATGGQTQAGAVVFSIHFSRASKLARLVAASIAEDGSMTLWDGTTGEVIQPPSRAGGGPGGGPGGGSSARPVVARLSPDQETLAVGESDGCVRLWDMVKGGLRARLKGHGDAVTDLDFCGSDPTALASASEDCRVRLWNAVNGRQVALLTGHTATVTAVAYSLDGAVVASGCEQGSIRLWATGDGAGRSAAVLQGHVRAVQRLSFCPDGGLLASGGADCSVRLWEVSSGKALAVLQGHKESVSRLVWAPSGCVLASGSRGDGSAGSVFVWDCRTGKSVYAVHAAYMAGEDMARPEADGGLCTVVSALEHAPHLSLVREAQGSGKNAAAVPAGETVAAEGLLWLRQVPVYTSFAAPACVAAAGTSFAMAFGAHVYFYRQNK